MKLNKKKVSLLLMMVSCWTSAIADDTTENIEALIASNPKLALQQAEDLWRNKQVSPQEVAAGVLLMNAMRANQEFDSAQQLLNQFLALSEVSKTHRLLLLTQQIYLARKSKSKADFTAVFEEANQLLADLNEQVNEKKVANAFYQWHQAVGYKYYHESSFADAEPYFEAAIKYLDKSRHMTHSDVLNGMGVVKAQQSDLAGAAQFMIQSIKVLEDNSLPVHLSRYMNIGTLNFMLKEWDRTIEYSEKALSMQTEVDARTASMLSNIAAAYVEKGELETATEKLQQSIAVSESLGTTTATARNNLGYINNQLGNYTEALEQLELAKQELIKNDSEEELSLNYKSTADVYANQQRYDLASQLYEQAYQLHMEHDFKVKRLQLYPKWIDVLVIKEDHKKAYEMMVEFKALNDEITNVESTKQVNELMAAFEVEKKERALLDSELAREQQQQNITMLESEAAFDQTIRYLLLMLMLGLAVILLLVYRSWRFRGKVNQVLLDKNQHIEKQHSQLQGMNEQLKNQAEIDSLTGLKNRRYLTQMIASEHAKNSTPQKQWCLIIMDLDDFKQINDQYGHQAGDDVLVKFAQCLQEAQAKSDVVVRWGGEEFLWLTEIESLTDGTQRCAELQQALTQVNWLDDQEINVTCSMGFSAFPLVNISFEDWEAALKLADYALYEAKNNGKNHWFGFEVNRQDLTYDDVKDIPRLISKDKIKCMTDMKSQAGKSDFEGR